MTLTVVTLTRPQPFRAPWLTECTESVAKALPRGARHIISVCDGDFERRRWETSVLFPGYVAWVDDDDRVVGDALAQCVQALDETGAGLAFTYEARIDTHGNRLHVDERPRTRRDLAMHPRSAHHLAVVRTSCLDPIVWEHASRIGIGVEWLMRAYAGLVHGAVQVPVVGYEWRSHEWQESRTAAWAAAYEEAMPALRHVIRPWMKTDAHIPVWRPAA